MSAILPEQMTSPIENACALAERWGEEDALSGSPNQSPRFYLPDSPKWNAYATGYARGKQLPEVTPPAPAPELSPPLPDPPGLWALSGFEDALFARPLRPQLPTDPTDRSDYHQGYAEGAAMLTRILAAPPPTVNDEFSFLSNS